MKLTEKIKEVPFTVVISWFMKGVLLVSLFYFIFHRDFLFIGATILAIISSLLPSILERSFRITLPLEIDFVITLSIFLHLFLGDALKFYSRFPGYDKFLHLFVSALLAFISFMIVFGLHYTGKVRLSVGLTGFFTVVFSMALGVLWEIGEFIVDLIFKVGAQGGLFDTMLDLILDTCGGIISAIFGMLYVKNLKPVEKRKLSLPVAVLWERFRSGKNKK